MSSFTTHHSLNPQQRREVIALIMTMTQSISASRSDLSAIRSELTSLRSKVDDLSSQFASTSSALAQLSTQCNAFSVEIASHSNAITTLVSTVTSHSDKMSEFTTSLTDASTKLSVVSDSVNQLSLNYKTLETDVLNAKTSLSALAAQVNSLESRLNDTTQTVPKQVLSPLAINEGALTLNMNPRFCSDNAGLASYSSQTLLQTFTANLSSSIPNTNLAATIIVHSHGSVSTFNLTSKHAFSPSTEKTQLTLDIRHFQPSPTDWSVLLAQPAFQASDFLGYAWASIAGIWSPITLVGRVSSNPKLITLQLGTNPMDRITGLVLTFSIDT
ncbi:sigma C capsid protein [Cangyuan orthoreovirus]|uniref:sigma C capsid protein n=1 Tax=Cangyuan orthoreovirus TaxID=1388882 RepID=UPI000535A8D4|nr:sigma C capsid protein [Cangyuan orthoreovirus]AIY28307.1 sigma C capsid protein [Cangyuan orthoreovirus]